MKRFISLTLVFVLALLCFAGCSKTDDKTIKIGASPSPHAEILNLIKEDLAAKGYTLEIKEYSDYVLPNEDVESGDLDANYFQHTPYMENFNQNHNTHLKAVASIHYEPYCIYGSKTTSLENVPEGAKILVPNDSTNEARALNLLQQVGLIKLKADAGIGATKNDIVENSHNLDTIEAEAAAIPRLMPDADFAIINGNYALTAGLKIADALASEDLQSLGATTYANIICVKEGNENTDAVKALKAALESKQVADFISEKYNGSVVSTVDNLTDGFDSSVDYAALAGTTISVAASPTPHAEILEVAKQILAEKDITLDIQTYNDYVVPNNVVEDGTVLANYFQHSPYLDDFNAEQGTHIVSVASIHVEPMGLYGGTQTTLDAVSGK